jgi:hypothetical protein
LFVFPAGGVGGGGGGGGPPRLVPAARALVSLVADSSQVCRMEVCGRIQLDPLSGVWLSLLCRWV